MKLKISYYNIYIWSQICYFFTEKHCQPHTHPKWYEKDFGMILIPTENSDNPFWIDNLWPQNQDTGITTHPEGALGRGLWRTVKVSITLPDFFLQKGPDNAQPEFLDQDIETIYSFWINNLNLVFGSGYTTRTLWYHHPSRRRARTRPLARC